MKKITPISTLLVLLSLLSLLLISADEPPDLVRLTVINQSGMNIALQMQGQQEEEMYYLSIAPGTLDFPTEKIFTIERDTYGTQLYYIESWDPVYGYTCSRPGPIVVDARHNVKVFVKPCDTTSRPSSESHIVKLPGPQRPSFDSLPTFWELRRWRFEY